MKDAELRKDKIQKIAELLCGLKAYEWNKIKIAIDKMYDEASNRLELSDASAIVEQIRLEYGIFN